MTVSKEVEHEIRVLHFGEHLPVGTIGSQLDVHDDVVRRVLGLLAKRPPAEPRPLAVDPVKEFIAETLASYPRLCSTRLFDMVQPRGYRGSVRTLRNYVRQVRPRPKREAFLRLVPLIAEQAQIDWAYVGDVAVPGGKRALWLFVMVLPWSRGMWGEFVFDLSSWSLLRSLARACGAFGGTPREWLFDNPKTVVLARHGAAACFHPALLELSGRYAARLKLCTPYKANQKGNVERTNRYLRDRFLAARLIHGIEQGNRELATFISDIAHQRPHPTLSGRTVGDCLEEERTRLMPLPQPPACTDQVVPVRVDKTAFCRFDTNHYSVGPEHVGKTLMLAADDHEVRIIEGASLIARHERCWGRRQLLETPEHRAALLAEKRGAGEAKGRDRLLAVVPAINALYERWAERGRNLGCMTARTLKLLDLYGQDTLAASVAQVIERGLHDPGAIASICEQQRRAHSTPVPIDIALADHVLDRDVIPHNLETYDVKPQRRN